MNAPEADGGHMSPAMFARVRELFAEVCGVPAAQQAAFIEARSGGDPALARAVRELVEALDTRSHHGRGPGGPAWSFEPADGRTIPESIGPYRVLGVIGQGGMGIVYLARQVNPQREVALKIVGPGRFSAQLRSRFGREIRALGRLEHPGITRIYEAGTAGTPQGEAAYFAMEYIRGERLDRAVETMNLDIRACVEIVARIADAVQHAHTRGIIHRDLKPGNILLTTGGTETGPAGSAVIPLATGCQPKILDFGVARLLEPDPDTDDAGTSVTETGLVVGTLGYMSPEQLAGEPGSIDARTDVYAIGVILYEMLAGRLPHEVRGRPLAEAARLTRDDPVAPLPEVAPRTSQKIDRDLKTIVHRAIERERDRRYPTAAALADDLRRYLQDQPILARPPSTLYQLHKFTRRHKGLVAGAAAALLMLVAGLAVSTTLYFREQAAHRAADAKDRLSTSVRDYMIEGLLMAASPLRKGHDVRMLDVLTEAADGLHERFAEEPEVEANIRLDLARVLSDVGKFDASKAEYLAAIPLLERTRGRDDLQTIRAVNGYGTLLQDMHDDAAWLAVARDALDRCNRALPRDHPQRLVAMSDLGGALVTMRSYDEARALLHEGLALAEKDPVANREAMGGILTWLGTCEQIAGTKEEAVSIRRRTLGFTERAYGPDHANTLAARHNLAVALMNDGRIKEAIEVARGIPGPAERLYPPGHPVRAGIYSMLGTLLAADRQFDEAERYLLLAYQLSADAAKEFDWITEQRIQYLRRLYGRWPGHADQLRDWCVQGIKARMMLAHANELQNLPDVLKSCTEELSGSGAAASRTGLLDEVWARRDELAPDGHPRRAAFFANYVRAVVSEQHAGHAAEAMAIADASLPYAIEPEFAGPLVAAARDMLSEPGVETPGPPPPADGQPPGR